MFYLKRKIKKCRFKSISPMNGLSIKPRGSKDSHVLSVTICDEEFKNIYIRKQLNKKSSKLCNYLYKFLISEDDSENGVKACLGEIEKAKSIIFNKYKEHMKNELYREFLAKVVLIENEFRDKYLERQYYANLISRAYTSVKPYEEEMEKGRSR